jgi:DNA-binding transcriptional MerR regulator
MNERTRQYSLERLSELTEVQQRTIRAYIAQGLLPSPVGKGRGAYYTEVHRKRLKVIKKLRDRYGLPLDQIRQHLMTVGENEDVQIVPSALASPLVISRAAKALPNRDSNASDDESADMEHEAIYAGESPAPSASTPGPASWGDSRLEQLVNALQQLVGLRTRGRSVRSEACSLVEITPDISLIIKGNYAPQEVALFEQIAQSLREALTRGLDLSQQTDDE